MAEMGHSVGWNSLLIELFWPKLCSNGSRKGWIRLWASELNRHFRTEADLFDFQCVLSKFHETLGCRKSIEELNSGDEKKLHFLKTKHILEKIRNNWQIIGWRLLARRPKGLSIDDSEITLFRLLVLFFSVKSRFATFLSKIIVVYFHLLLQSLHADSSSYGAGWIGVCKSADPWYF